MSEVLAEKPKTHADANNFESCLRFKPTRYSEIESLPVFAAALAIADFVASIFSAY